MHLHPNVQSLICVFKGALCCFHVFLCLEELSAFHLLVLKQYCFFTVFCKVLYKCHRERCPSFKEPL